MVKLDGCISPSLRVDNNTTMIELDMSTPGIYGKSPRVFLVRCPSQELAASIVMAEFLEKNHSTSKRTLDLRICSRCGWKK